MTRINATIKPAQLCDQHLLAEYKELPRVFTLAHAWQGAPLPEKFTLGKGHVKFFYDKLEFVIKRYRNICRELTKRSYNLDSNIYYSIHSSYASTIKKLRNDYVPTPEAHAILCVRIQERLNEMEKITFNGVPVSADTAFKKITYGSD